MATTVRDAFYQLLRARGITTVFGNPGSNELPLLTNFPDDFQYLLALQEGVAVGMADGYALITGRPSLVNLHAAAGTGNAMGNLTNTMSGHVPVVVTSGQQARRHIALNAMLTNVDAIKLAEPLVKWSAEPSRPQDVPQVLSEGLLRAAAAPAGPVYLSLPLDDCDAPADIDALRGLEQRQVDGAPLADGEAVRELAARLAHSADPVLVLGPGADTDRGWKASVQLAERLGLPVWVAPSPSRCPFPTRHPLYRGILPAGIATVAEKLAKHDLIVTMGSAVFRYHEYVAGNYLPVGAELWGVTSDPDEATRAPVGRLIVGDPAEALERVLELVPERPSPEATSFGEPVIRADTAGPPFSAEAILDAIDEAKDDDTIIALEWTSVDILWDRLDLSMPRSLFFPASGGLGWGLPAAIGMQLADPTRRVLALIGDGALHYTVSGLWTAAHYNIPVVFVVPRNSEYAALKKFTRLMHAPDTPGLELPDMDVVALATSYGISSQRVDSLADLTTALSKGLTGNRPVLIEVPQQRLPD